jgi:hypothetical protein
MDVDVPCNFFNGSLKTPYQISILLNISTERIEELCEAGFMPHYYEDGTGPLLKYSEVKIWCAKNLTKKCTGKDLPINIVVNNYMLPPFAGMPPKEISETPNLREIPIEEYPPGIYFLVKKNRVVYVGQSIRPVARIYDHRKDKEFDRVYLLPVPRFCLDQIEGFFIRKLNPVLNTGDRPVACGPGCRTNDDLAESLVSSCFGGGWNE